MTDPTKAFSSLLKTLRAKHEPVAPPERGLVEELVYSFLLWESTTPKAEAAFKRFTGAMSDFNELRVSRTPELIALMGRGYPLVEERAQRLRAALNEVFVREYAVSLDACAALGKRDARKYLDTLDGMPPFVAARLVAVRLGGHAIPVDERLLGRLVEAGVVDEQADVAKAEGVLERLVKAGEATATHALLQAWADEAPLSLSRPERPKPEEARPPAKKPAKPSESAEAPAPKRRQAAKSGRGS